MLDHIVAGGLPHGISITDNVIKECAEEAGMPVELASRATPVGAISYQDADVENKEVSRDLVFCFDLELPLDFVPTAMDGEVQQFELRTIDWVMETLFTGGASGYKPNCNLVVIDFMMR